MWLPMGQCFHIVSYGYLFFAWGLAIPQAFNGAGDTLTPAKINFFCFWLLEIPLAYLLAIRLGIQPVGVYWSIVVAESMAGIVAIIWSRGVHGRAKNPNRLAPDGRRSDYKGLDCETSDVIIRLQLGLID